VLVGSRFCGYRTAASFQADSNHGSFLRHRVSSLPPCEARESDGQAARLAAYKK